MKMKRFFTNRNKKKKVTDSGSIYDAKILEISDNDISSDSFGAQNNVSKITNKKKQRQQKKKLKKQKSTESNVVQNTAAIEVGRSFITSNGTSVVLRRASESVEHDKSYTRTARQRDGDCRIPGSESSSRTASSASSHSSSARRWSSRRPWSLVETMRGQSLDEFSEYGDRNVPSNLNECSVDRHNLTVPLACTLPKGACLEEFGSNGVGSGKEHKSRTVTLNIFRRLRRNTGSGNSEDKEKPTSTPSSGSLSSGGRGSFRLKGKKTKKKRLSYQEHNFHSILSNRSSSSSVASSHSDCNLTGRRLPSGSESLTFDPTEASIPEDQIFTTPCSTQSLANRSSYVRSSSNGSSASTNTVISVSESHKNRLSQRHSGDVSIILHTESGSNRSSLLDSCSDKDMSRCEACLKLRRGSKQSICQCDFTSPDTQISIVDTDSVTTYVNTTSRVIPSSQLVHNIAHTLDSRVRNSYGSSRELYDSSSFTTGSNSTVEATAVFGGSLQCISKVSGCNTSNNTSNTLPRSYITNEIRLRLKSPKNSAVYASSPQLSVPFRKSMSEDKVSSRERPKSSSVRFQCSEEPQKTQQENGNHPFASMTSPHVKQLEHTVVDSPIKRAIGYPGVVLRRHQNRRTKKSQGNQQLNKASSGDILTRERRAKQVMSLNMEDLPTYGQMQDDVRWRSVSLFARDRSGQNAFNASRTSVVETGRARLRAAVLYQRYASHCTSVDDVSAVQPLFGGKQSMEDLSNMDDDEFLDFYLSPRDASEIDRYANRSSQSQEPSSKRVKTLRKSVQSFANLISPGKPGRNKIQRSSSFKESAGPAFKPYRPPGSQGNRESSGVSGGSGNTPGRRGTGSVTKNRRSKLWCETFDHTGIDEAELKRQEAIFELYQGECVMVQDLKMAKQTYRDSMMTLKMLTGDEVTRIFGKLDCLLPLHEDLLARLERGMTKGGRTEEIGHVFIDWFPTLSPYNEYCANQADAKETLDAVVGREARVRDFLQRCLESPFSRKLDLWSYLDLPRSRLVKYPLLLKAILKVTPPDHTDAALLEKALSIINDIIVRVDDLTGERQSRFVQSKLEYLDDKQKCAEVEESRTIICSGQLKGSRGTKLHVFLFDLVLVLTRNATRGDKLTYQVYRQPLPLKSLIVETEEGGKLGGSFRGGILSNDKAKHSFRVRSEELNVAYTLVATDEHDKKQWVNALQEAVNKCRSSIDDPAEMDVPISRRAGSEKSALDKSTEKVTVKRSSSVKSESGSFSPWYRNRSMTVNGQSVRRNSSKDKKESADMKKKSRMSPLSIRRSSKSLVVDASKNIDAIDMPSDAKLSLLDIEKSSCRRSRSLTSSPITFLANLPRRSQRSGSALARSESCSTKPPTGRVHLLTHAYNLRSSKTPPRSPRLHPTRSIPDLSSWKRVSQASDAPSLEDVKSRLAPLANSSEVEAGIEVNVKSPTPESVDSPLHSSTTSTQPTHKPPRLSSVSHLIIDSPDHPAASNTSQNFPIVEEDSVSPIYKSVTSSMHTSASSPAISSFYTPPVAMPTIQWAKTTSEPSIASDTASSTITKDVSSSTLNSTSSESLHDVTPLMDDVTMILDGAADNDVTPTNEMEVMTDSSDVVLDTINELISRVCDVQRVDYGDGLTVTCHDDFITITSDDGLPWRGNDVEMTA